ncbi:MAG TPA: N-acetylgalactosamine 6-sulfate sulfatase [Porticoccaceae bacterium]|nr:N-acetylgalactosamine 6-sulfate sulfatase [Porticoccaceae bacterium]
MNQAPVIAPNLFKFAVIVTSLLVLGGCVDAPKRPHVVLLMADDMGWAQTGYYGHPIMRTPNLDAMAKNGLRMDRFYAGSPSCTPTRASVLTGRTNDRTGAFRVGSYLNKQEKVLPTAFKEAGYKTGHFGKWHLNRVGTEEALDHHPLPADDPHNPGAFGFDYWVSHTSGWDLDPELSRNGEREQFEGEGSVVIVDEALKFIAREVSDNSPIFVVIWYSAPHGPWAASDEDIAPFLGKVDRTSAHAHGEIIGMDRSIGNLRRGLEDLGIADDTLIWFTSDNGGSPNMDVRVWAAESLLGGSGGQGIEMEYPSTCSDEIDPDLNSHEARDLHGCIRGLDPDSTGHLRGFKKDFYEGGLRVPTIVEWPAKIEPRVSNFPSVTMDIFPTLIDVAGLDPASINQVHDGISLAEVFQKEPARREKPLGFRANGGLMWLNNDWKLVRNVDYTGKTFVTTPYQLYNIVGDPSEENNLIDLYPDIAERMKNEYAAWSLTVSRSAFGADYPEGKVLPSGRELTLRIEKTRQKQQALWREEIARSEITVLP